MKKILALTMVAVLSLAYGANLVFATSQNPGVVCDYALTASSGQSGTALVKARFDQLRITLDDADPNMVYTVWLDYKNRATGALAADYPAGAIARGVAPAFATTAGTTAGIGIDPNGVKTNQDGKAFYHLHLDYNVLLAGDGPVVNEELDMQGLNRVGGHWMRVYGVDENTQVSLQLIDPETGFPKIERSTVQGITIVSHPDGVTHGHTPGVSGVDHFSAFKGDFPTACLEQ